MSFGEILKKARKKARKTLKEAAEHVGLTIGNISDFEHNRRRPPREDILIKLEQFYSLSKDKLVKAALNEWKIPDDIISNYRKRPNTTMLLFRTTKDFTEGELIELIEVFKKQRRK